LLNLSPLVLGDKKPDCRIILLSTRLVSFELGLFILLDFHPMSTGFSGFLTGLRIGYTAKGQREYQTFRAAQEFFGEFFATVKT
jgi:hypothetical protein